MASVLQGETRIVYSMQIYDNSSLASAGFKQSRGLLLVWFDVVFFLFLLTKIQMVLHI